MLERYKESLSDLVHLLKVDPKNSAAQREVDIVKDYWRKVIKRPKFQFIMKLRHVEFHAFFTHSCFNEKQRKLKEIKFSDFK